MAKYKQPLDDHSGHHIVPFRTLIIVFLSLIGLTALTYLTATYVDAGRLNVPIAIAIASTKALLVVMFFMALKYDARINVLLFSVGGIFVLIFMSFTALDVFFRDLVDPVEADTVWEVEAAEAARAERDSLIGPLMQAYPIAPGMPADTVTNADTAAAE